MPAGLTCTQISRLYGCQPTKATQLLQPAVAKLAVLWRVAPELTLRAVMDAAAELGPMSEREIQMREELLTGRIDRARLHPEGRT